MHSANTLLVASLIVAVAIQLLAPLLLAVFIVRRFQAGWWYLLLGIAVMLIFQGVLRIPFMLMLQTNTHVAEWITSSAAARWSFLFFASFTAGLFEEGGRWLAIRYLVPPEDRRWNTALALGAGHGGLESIGVGLTVLVSLATYWAALMPPEAVPSLAPYRDQILGEFQKLQGWEPLLGAWERLAALVIQLGLAVMVWLSFVRGARWWWLALASHTLINFSALAAIQLLTPPVGSTVAMVLTELIVSAFAVAAWFFIRRARAADINPPLVAEVAEPSSP